jgi:hypothetical protein
MDRVRSSSNITAQSMKANNKKASMMMMMRKVKEVSRRAILYLDNSTEL